MIRSSSSLPARWLVGACLFLVACVSAPEPSDGRTDFEFTDWAGPALTVFAVEPEGLAPDAPVVIVMHGVKRNADDYRDNWVDLANTYGFRIYAPMFDQASFPGADYYNLGGVGTDAVSAYDAIEPMFDFVISHRGVTAGHYTIFGHSAGSQFVHRFVCFADPARMDLAITANAGWYTMPTDEAAWPYGLGGIDTADCNVSSWLARPMLVLLGDRDVDPMDPNLRRTPEALAQGQTRFERGHRFYDLASRVAEALDVEFGWTKQVVPGVAHDNRGMALAAADVIAAREAANVP
jgi:poly(3-hydroxybutyrate) depolymerase